MVTSFNFLISFFKDKWLKKTGTNWL